MIDWKQRLYAFLLRRVLGPLLDASSAQKLHESIDVSLQEGKFVLKHINLDASYLTKQLSDNIPGLIVRSGRVENLEINLTLRENFYEKDESTRTQSSLAWRAMKLGSLYESLPAVSLIADSKIDGVFLEFETIGLKFRKAYQDPSSCDQIERNDKNTDEEASSNFVGSYIKAALSTLQLGLKLNNIQFKFCHQSESSSHRVWVGVKVSSFSYNDLDIGDSNNMKSSLDAVVINKVVEFTKIIVETGEDSTSPDSTPFNSVVALAEGSGQLFLRVVNGEKPQIEQSSSNKERIYLQRDVEVRLNHHLNFSFDIRSLRIFQQLLLDFSNVTETNTELDDVSFFRQSSIMNNPHIESSDRDDLKAINGIMKQYREAYHLAEQNKVRGGILVPTNAYLDEAVCVEDSDDKATFDIFFDANDQSVYNMASILLENARLPRDYQKDVDHHLDQVHTKIRISLLGSSFKINFPQPGLISQHLHSKEYILVTLSDINVAWLSTQRTSEVLLDVTHIQIEDAYLPNKDEINGYPIHTDDNTAKIGSILGWSEDYGCEAYDALVSDAPCLRIEWKCTLNDKKNYYTTCDTTLLALELSYRHRTMDNISKFALMAKNRFTEMERLVSSSSTSVCNESTEDSMQIHLTLKCPSLSISVPLIDQTKISQMFERCGETFTSRVTREICIGITFEDPQFLFESQQGKKINQSEAYISGKFWCHHMGLFAISPKDESWYEPHLIRKDIFVASGRMQVNPFTPISFSFMRLCPTLNEENIGRESFPIVPAISSFKARQEDDDDDEKTESGNPVFSKFKENVSSCIKDLRTDPQITMLANCEKSTLIFSIEVPEVILDLTPKELEISLLMLTRMKKSHSPNKEEIPMSTSEANFSDKLSTSIHFDEVSITIRDGENDVGFKKIRKRISSFLFALDEIKFHLFLVGSQMKHFRFFSQDLCLYSQANTPKNLIGDQQISLRGRFKILKDTLRAFSEVSVVPILFRSQLFRPISHDTPSILFDFIDTTISKTSSLQQRRVYLTVYHLTFRYDADSDWSTRLSAMLPLLRNLEYEDSKKDFESMHSIGKSTQTSLTRLFITFADVNVDYKSPSYFETASKSIIRVGDFRLSGNMISPVGHIQSYNLSVGDVILHITNDIFKDQYENENKLLCRSSLLMKRKRISTGRKSPYATTPEAILREQEFVDILSLDSMDVVITQRRGNDSSKYDRSKDPPISIVLTVGTITVHACKDSFTCFANSVGELQSKLIGLSDDDIEKLKENPSFPMLISESVETKVQNFDRLGGIRQHVTQDIEIPTIMEDGSFIPLLDGHEWMTVDKDPLPELAIPHGDEQVAGWYSKYPNRPGEILPPSQIRQQHFPFHTSSNPVMEEDILTRTLGGIEHLILKSHLFINKLNVKIRLFDGYDWPDSCSNVQKKALKRVEKAFVIEQLPESKAQGEKKEGIVEENISQKAKRRLMEDLLDSDNKDFEAFFEDVPLPEDKASIINHKEYLRLSRRRSNVFCQLSLNGITLTMDSYQQSEVHRLQSVLKLDVSDLFVAETISDSKPIKMISEWSNDHEHPHDTRFGTLMLSMATWAPLTKITENNEIASEESNITAQLMPIRCLLDQRAISFLKAFFNNDDMDGTKGHRERRKWCCHLHLPPPPTFKIFKVKSLKVKVDYYPSRINVAALREGSVVELVNLSPIQRMVITLDEVLVMNSDGAGPAFSEVVSTWIKQICATQLHKFLTNARPFEPITDVGQGLTDLVILPYEAFKQGDSIQKAMKRGMKSLAETVVFQTLATTSGLTKIAADLMADSLKGGNNASDPLPTRPLSIPKGIGDARLHAARSLARGFSAANYKIVIVPYREYLRNGMSGAMTSVIKGIPVLLVAPLTGATEATSYTLLGARHALRPDLRKEEEACIL